MRGFLQELSLELVENLQKLQPNSIMEFKMGSMKELLDDFQKKNSGIQKKKQRFQVGIPGGTYGCFHDKKNEWFS